MAPTLSQYLDLLILNLALLSIEFVVKFPINIGYPFIVTAILMVSSHQHLVPPSAMYLPLPEIIANAKNANLNEKGGNYM